MAQQVFLNFLQAFMFLWISYCCANQEKVVSQEVLPSPVGCVKQISPPSPPAPLFFLYPWGCEPTLKNLKISRQQEEVVVVVVVLRGGGRDIPTVGCSSVPAGTMCRYTGMSRCNGVMWMQAAHEYYLQHATSEVGHRSPICSPCLRLLRAARSADRSSGPQPDGAQRSDRFIFFEGFLFIGRGFLKKKNNIYIFSCWWKKDGWLFPTGRAQGNPECVL